MGPNKFSLSNLDTRKHPYILKSQNHISYTHYSSLLLFTVKGKSLTVLKEKMDSGRQYEILEYRLSSNIHHLQLNHTGEKHTKAVYLIRMW